MNATPAAGRGATRMPMLLFFAGAALGLLAVDLRFLLQARAVFGQLPGSANPIDVIFPVVHAACLTVAYATGALVVRRWLPGGMLVAAGVAVAMLFVLPRSAAYATQCAPLCNPHPQLLWFALAAAFALGLVGGLLRGPPMGPVLRWPRGSQAVSLAILAPLFALVGWFVPANTWAIWLSSRQYTECVGITLPTRLDTLALRFGPGSRAGTPLASGPYAGYESYSFDPNWLYGRELSSGVDATVEPGTRRVVELDCGEGW